MKLHNSKYEGTIEALEEDGLETSDILRRMEARVKKIDSGNPDADEREYKRNRTAYINSEEDLIIASHDWLKPESTEIEYASFFGTMVGAFLLSMAVAFILVSVANSVIGNDSWQFWIILVFLALWLWFTSLLLEKDARRKVEQAFRSGLILEGNRHKVGPYEKALTKEDPSRHNS